jgi:hypothetical protein
MATTSASGKVRVLRRARGGLQPEVKPIVLEYKKEKKTREDEDNGKEGYSEGLEDIQRLEKDVLRVSQRAAKSLSKGIDTYQEERQKSAEEKKDGAIEDFVHNSAKAMSVSIKEASEIPMDIAEAVNKKSYRKRLRQTLRQASRVIRFWQI